MTNNRLPVLEAGGEAERVARAICKAKGVNPDMCVLGSGGVSFVDGKVKFTSECHRFAWQDELVAAHAAIALLTPGPVVNAGEEAK